MSAAIEVSGTPLDPLLNLQSKTWPSEYDIMTGKIKGVVYTPDFLVGPRDYDGAACRVPREQALLPFKDSPNQKIAQAYSYWMNETWQDSDIEVPFLIQKNCTDEVQVIRTHLAKIIHEDFQQLVHERREAEKNQCNIGKYKLTIISVMLLATALFLIIYFKTKAN